MFIVKYVIFCFNDTAPTDSYTYLLTLSLHVALPIESLRTCASSASSIASARLSFFTPSRVNTRTSMTVPSMPAGTRRSEEHTSELQSLMRISYAVFCLKKKINTNHHYTHTKSTDK